MATSRSLTFENMTRCLAALLMLILSVAMTVTYAELRSMADRLRKVESHTVQIMTTLDIHPVCRANAGEVDVLLAKNVPKNSTFDGSKESKESKPRE